MPTPSSAISPCAPLRFVWAWLGTVVLTAGLLFPLFTLATLNWFSSPETYWIDQLYQRKLRSLAKRPPAKGPRLLVFGGSATVFGVDAELMEKELGISTVNFATHAALGLDYQISRIERTARKNDSVLFCPEWDVFQEGEAPTENLREYAFTYDKRYVLSLTPKIAFESLFLTPTTDYLDSIARWNERLTGKAEPEPSEIRHGYSLMQLSPNGDLRGAMLEKHPNPEPFPNNMGSHAKQSLAALHRWCRQRNVRLLLAWANHMEPPPPSRKEDFTMFPIVGQFCQEEGIPLVGSAEESIYPKELFIDSIYHLTAIGRRIHTEKLIGHLRKTFGSQPPSGPKIVCVLSANSPAVDRTDIFERQESVEYRYLSDLPLDRNDCISPPALRALASSGASVTCIDDATEAVAQNAGLQSKEIRRRETSFADWIRRYDHHLLLLSLVGMDHCPVTLEHPTPYFARFLSAEGFRVGLIGTGPYKDVHRISAGIDAAKWSKRRHEFPLAPPALNLRLMLRSGPLQSFDKGNPAILVEGERLSDLTPGLSIAAIDPLLGIVADKAVFQEDRVVEWKLRRLIVP